jgi:hypothetical protein
MKPRSMIVAALIFAAALTAIAEQAQSVSASIGTDCQSKPATFSVPDGKTAYAFNVAKLEPGSACHGEAAPPENKGFSIRDGKGRQVYTWSQYQTQTPYEKGGPLKNLTLIPGSYTLSMAGGAGAKVELSYQLK